jgi:hypothetical protein
MPGTAGPHGLVCDQEGTREDFTAGAGSGSGIPRAVFLGLLRTSPGGLMTGSLGSFIHRWVGNPRLRPRGCACEATTLRTPCDAR